MLTRIICGGQTGADRAALDAALDAGLPIGGKCPLGRMAEDGPIDSKYALTEINGDNRERTCLNVADSDGTAIFYKGYLKGGTELTVFFCIRHNKPYKLIDIELLDPSHAAEQVRGFVHEFNVHVLNVAGPRASACPTMYAYVRQVIGLVIGSQTWRKSPRLAGCLSPSF